MQRCWLLLLAVGSCPLLCLLLLSLVLAYVPMGLITPTAGVVIAFIKAGLVILLFMELAASKALIRLAAMAGVVFLTALFTLTLADVPARKPHSRLPKGRPAC